MIVSLLVVIGITFIVLCQLLVFVVSCLISLMFWFFR